MNQLEATLTSLEVSEMVGRQHSEVLKDIRRIERQLPEVEIHLGDYFIESMYRDSNNQQRPQFLLTKKGCELYGTRMTGEKGTQFAVQYIERFNEMENHIKEQPQLPMNNTKLLLETALEHEEKIEEIKIDVTMLKDTMRIDGRQEYKLTKFGRGKVVKTLGGKNAPAYKEISRSVFQMFWNEFKDHFSIPRYNELPKKDYDEAIRFIELWQPKTSDRLRIDAINNQMVMEGESS